jgi:hypothetical protein
MKPSPSQHVVILGGGCSGTLAGQLMPASSIKPVEGVGRRVARPHERQPAAQGGLVLNASKSQLRSSAHDLLELNLNFPPGLQI